MGTLKKFIGSKVYDEISDKKYVSLNCNLTNKGALTFVTKSSTLTRNLINITHANTKSGSCCISETNLLISYGTECPKLAKDLFRFHQKCVFSTFIDGQCNDVIKQRPIYRFCKTPNSICVLQELYRS